MYKLLLVDDEFFVRMGMRETIDWEKVGVEYIGDAANGKEGFRLACELEPDIIITDIRMPEMDGLELIDACRKQGLKAQFIVLSAHNEFNYAKEALQLGVCDYVLKPTAEDQLLQAVRKAIAIVEKANKAAADQNLVGRFRSAAKDYVLLKVILDTTLDDGEIRSEFASVSLEVPESGNFVVFVRIRDYYLLLQNHAQSEISRFHGALNEQLRRALSDYKPEDRWILSSERSNLILMAHDDQEEKAAVSRLQNRLAALCRSMEERFPNFTVTIGISRRTGSLQEISQGYTQAYTAAYMNTVISKNCVNYIMEGSDGNFRWEIAGALSYINAHYSEDISIESIAAALFISPSHLMHLFKEVMGKTINESITEYRMQAAQLMLRNSNFSIAEISERSGYKNAKYFTRVFKRCTGMTPSEYARKTF